MTTAIIFVILVIFALCIWCYEYTRWDKGIEYKQQYLLDGLFPFNKKKGIVFISRDMIGLWLDEDHIYPLRTFDMDIERIKNLHKYNNIILYIPKKDRSDIEVNNFKASIQYIASHGFPVTYITQKLPPRFTVNPVEVGKNRWILEYKKEYMI